MHMISHRFFVLQQVCSCYPLFLLLSSEPVIKELHRRITSGAAAPKSAQAVQAATVTATG
jgi:hypothetical protein